MDLSKSESTVPGGLETLDLNDVAHDLEVHRRDQLDVHQADLDSAGDLKPVQDMEDDRSLEQGDRLNSGEDTDDSLTDPVHFSRSRREKRFNGQLEDESLSLETLTNEEESLDLSELDQTAVHNRRHYKKDSRYLEDLYTLTFQPDDSWHSEERESMQDDVFGTELDLQGNERNSSGLISLQVQTPRHSALRINGPQSLMPLVRTNSLDLKETASTSGEAAAARSSSVLEINLHKILARRMQEGQEVSFGKAKLLTKVYYSLLRDSTLPSTTNTFKARKPDPQLDWATLIHADIVQLRNIVSGYSAIISTLNDDLLRELQTKDELSADQDGMLETISDITNSLL